MAGGNETQRSDRLAEKQGVHLHPPNLLAIPCDHCDAFPPAVIISVGKRDNCPTRVYWVLGN
ncbi:MAG: hypothetical protein LBC02_09445 [Planctomycetaceae bacterium]|nr:hypothetical protein [Planctomycetaceae bacterium]